MLPETDVARVRRWVDARNDALPERTASRRVWAIYWRDRNLKFHRHDPVGASRHIVELLDAVDNDRSGIFWG